ncbi:MAG TPA: TOBE-like domain-containing protein, partial [Ferrovibrio sp.]|uniref:TOBE-like domain-containing protein n=1 Tax=Ferrovibrio sp. TaxID=1917215 RepID=UPI002B4ACB49
VHLPNGPARLYVRPHDLEMEASADGRALVRFVSPIGAVVRSEVELPEGQLVEVMQLHERFEQQPLQPGDRVVLTAKRGQVFPPAS